MELTEAYCTQPVTKQVPCEAYVRCYNWSQLFHSHCLHVWERGHESVGWESLIGAILLISPHQGKISCKYGHNKVQERYRPNRSSLYWEEVARINRRNPDNNDGVITRTRYLRVWSQVGLRKHHYKQSYWRWWNSSWAISNPERWCCENAVFNIPANLENSAVATGLEKGQVSFQSQRKAMRKKVKSTTQLHASHMPAK